MGIFRITFEYIPDDYMSEKYSMRSDISEESYYSSNEVLQYVFRDLVKEVVFMYEIEKENNRYNPKNTFNIPLSFRSNIPESLRGINA